jgi:hypothetical protein
MYGTVSYTKKYGVINQRKVYGKTNFPSRYGVINQRKVQGKTNLTPKYGIVSFPEIPLPDLYSAEALALFARMPAQPTPTVQLLINKLIVDYKNCGYWDLCDVIVKFNIYDAASGLLNLKGNVCNATAVNSPTWTKYYGYKGSGAGAYVNTNYRPYSNGVNYSLNNAHFYEDIDLVSTAGSACCDGCGDGINGTVLITNNNVSFIHYNRVNSLAYTTIGLLQQGSVFLSRNVSTHFESWINGSKTTNACVSTILVNRPFYIFGLTWHATANNPYYMNASRLRGYSMGAYCNDTIKQAVKEANDYFNTNIINAY